MLYVGIEGLSGVCFSLERDEGTSWEICKCSFLDAGDSKQLSSCGY